MEQWRNSGQVTHSSAVWRLRRWLFETPSSWRYWRIALFDLAQEGRAGVARDGQTMHCELGRALAGPGRRCSGFRPHSCRVPPQANRLHRILPIHGQRALPTTDRRCVGRSQAAAVAQRPCSRGVGLENSPQPGASDGEVASGSPQASPSPRSPEQICEAPDQFRSSQGAARRA